MWKVVVRAESQMDLFSNNKSEGNNNNHHHATSQRLHCFSLATSSLTSWAAACKAFDNAINPDDGTAVDHLSSSLPPPRLAVVGFGYVDVEGDEVIVINQLHWKMYKRFGFDPSLHHKAPRRTPQHHHNDAEVNTAPAEHSPPPLPLPSSAGPALASVAAAAVEGAHRAVLYVKRIIDDDGVANDIGDDDGEPQHVVYGNDAPRVTQLSSGGDVNEEKLSRATSTPTTLVATNADVTTVVAAAATHTTVDRVTTDGGDDEESKTTIASHHRRIPPPPAPSTLTQTPPQSNNNINNNTATPPNDSQRGSTGGVNNTPAVSLFQAQQQQQREHLQARIDALQQRAHSPPAAAPLPLSSTLSALNRAGSTAGSGVPLINQQQSDAASRGNSVATTVVDPIASVGRSTFDEDYIRNSAAATATMRVTARDLYASDSSDDDVVAQPYRRNSNRPIRPQQQQQRGVHYGGHSVPNNNNISVNRNGTSPASTGAASGAQYQHRSQHHFNAPPILIEHQSSPQFLQAQRRYHHQQQQPAPPLPGGVGEMVVFATEVGNCYHNQSCQYHRPARYLAEADAQRTGLRPCEKCGGSPFRRPLQPQQQ